MQGDWNFKQIADGIYESINNIPTLPVTEGGTGLNTVAVNSLLIGQGQLPLSTLAMGSANEVLKVNSGGTALEFGAASGGGAVSAVANGANNRVATFSSADALNGEANLTFDGSTLAVTGDLNVGSGDLFVDDSSGRVGIGIGTSPINLLHIKGDNSITNQNSGGAASITIEQDGTGDAAINLLLTAVRRWIVGIDNSDGDKFKIQTGATELDGTSHVPALTIADNGDTGINQTDPQALLHIKGSENSWDKHIRLEDHDTTSYAAIVYDDQGLKLRTFDASSSGSSAPTDRFYFRNSANTSTFFVDNDGDVEIPIGSLTIGNDSPTAAGGVIMDSNAVSGAGLANGAAATLFTVPTTRQAYDATIYFYDVTNGEYQVEKIIGHNTGSGVNYSTFGQVFSGSAAIGSLDAVNSSGTTLIQFTNNQGGSINYQAKISITHMEAS